MYGGNDEGGASQFAGGGFMPSPGGAPGGFKAGGGMSTGIAAVGPKSLTKISLDHGAQPASSNTSCFVYL